METLATYIDHTRERDNAMRAARTIFTRRDAIIDQIRRSGSETEIDEKFARLAEADILMLFAMLLWETNESINLYNAYKTTDKADSVPSPHTYLFLAKLLVAKVGDQIITDVLKERGFQLFDWQTPTAFDYILQKQKHSLCAPLLEIFWGYIKADTRDKQNIFVDAFLANFGLKRSIDSYIDRLEQPEFVKARVRGLCELCGMVLPYSEEELARLGGQSTPGNAYASTPGVWTRGSRGTGRTSGDV